MTIYHTLIINKDDDRLLIDYIIKFHGPIQEHNLHSLNPFSTHEKSFSKLNPAHLFKGLSHYLSTPHKTMDGKLSFNISKLIFLISNLTKEV